MNNEERLRKVLEDGIRQEFHWAATYGKQIDSHLNSIEHLRKFRKDCFKNMENLQQQLDKLNEAEGKK